MKPPSSWHPIATAPQDSRQLWLRAPGVDPFIGQWGQRFDPSLNGTRPGWVIRYQRDRDRVGDGFNPEEWAAVEWPKQEAKVSEKTMYGIGGVIFMLACLAVIYWSLSGIVRDIARLF